MEDLLPQINVPVLVVRGGSDPICRHGWAEEVARRLPQGRLVVIPGVHHTLVFTHPLELVRVCRPFLDARNPSSRAARATRPPQPADDAPAEVPIAGFDSASAMVRALGRFLDGRDFPVLGLWPRWTEPALRLYGAAVNALPGSLRRQVYIWSGWSESVAAERLGGVRAEQIAQWAVGEYPRKRYPAAMIGASNGALVHLCAALGIPWLPQTVLIPVARSGVHPDEVMQDLEWGRGPAARLLAANPDLALHHMHDPNQDQLMIQRMSYFRVKYLRLPEHYRRFLTETLEPGATLFIVECNLYWPTTQVAERYVFQRGALGGATPEEYLRGSPRIAEFLQRQVSHVRRWEGPAPDGERPEAEWGFEPALRAEVEEFAREHGLRVRRILFNHPEDTSPLVADLYRHWYRQRQLPANRLLVESFIVMEPWWTLRTGSVPFWAVFNVEPSAEALERYLDSTEPYDEINLMLFSHGVNSVGLASIDRWHSVLQRARRRGRFVGVDERAYPQDFAIFPRYRKAIQQAIAARYPMPRPLTLRELDAFLAEPGARYAVRWEG